MSDSNYTPPLRLTPTLARPLLGLTILVVEDSRYASEAVRLMCLRSGARIRRADCLRSAKRHLAAYRPSAAIIDMGLPDGSGLDLIREIALSADPINALIACSAQDTLRDEALEAGAKAFLPKPIPTIGEFQEAILNLLPKEARPAGLRALSGDRPEPDTMALKDDLMHAADLMADDGDTVTTGYVAQFLQGVGQSSADQPLIQEARRVADELAASEPPDLSPLRSIVKRRLQAYAPV